MSTLPRLRLLPRIVLPLAALGYLLFLTAARLHRVDAVTNLVETGVSIDAGSPTGYTGELRNLIVPEHNNESYQWILQTQQMLAPNGPWRIRQVAYDNAPIGRAVLTPSPYRWWLGLVAQAEHEISGEPIGVAVERAARIADPVLHLLFLISATAFVAWRFGSGPAGLLALAVATLFPFGGTFLPGQPGDGSLVLVFLCSSALLLLAGIHPAPVRDSAAAGSLSTHSLVAARLFFAAGVAGGLGFWVDAIRSVPALAGISVGGLFATWCARRAIKAGDTPTMPPWRHWALGGSATILVTYLLEYSPSHLGTLHLAEVHPLYGIAWLGLGELLTRLNRCSQQKLFWHDWRNLAGIGASALGVAAVPASLVLTTNSHLFTIDPNTTRLTSLVGGPIAQNLWGWLSQEGITIPVLATLLPLLLLVAAGVLLIRSGADWRSRAMLAVGAGPALVMLGFSCFRLRGWNEFDAVILGLFVAISAAARTLESKLVRGVMVAGMLLVLAPGAILLTDEALANRRDPATALEITSLIERDLAHWLGRQAGPDGAVVFAPPNLTTSLIYHGGLAGIGTPFWENQAGVVASMRIAGSSSPDEAHALIQNRNLAYIVMPSWDGFLAENVRRPTSEPGHTLIALLHRWLPPRWLRPIPYHLPSVAGFESQSVAIFRVVEVQDNATALSYLAEYFVEMGMMREAVTVAHALQESFPADLSAAVARALVARAATEEQSFNAAFADLQASLARGDSEFLSWDRRVSLTIALAEARELDTARAELRRCLAEIDEVRMRSLTTMSLRRLLLLCRSSDLKIDNPQLLSLAQQLLPPELRGDL